MKIRSLGTALFGVLAHPPTREGEGNHNCSGDKLWSDLVTSQVTLQHCLSLISVSHHKTEVNP